MSRVFMTLSGATAGVALLPVLLLCLVLALAALALQGDLLLQQRLLQRVEESTEEQESLSKAVALAEAQIRTQIRGESREALPADSSDSSDTSLADPARWPLEVRTHHAREVLVTERAADGSWRREWVPAIAMPWVGAMPWVLAQSDAAGSDNVDEDVDEDAAEDGAARVTALLVDAILSAAATHSDDARAHASAEWLAIELSRSFPLAWAPPEWTPLARRAAAVDADRLRQLVQDTLSRAPSAHVEWLSRQRASIVAALDPVSRLRRTNSHPARLFRGRDRGHVARGAVLVPAVPAALTMRSANKIHRAPLVRRMALRTQSDWQAGSVDQPAGVVVGAPLGPEVLADADWQVGASVLVGRERAAPLAQEPAASPRGTLLALAPGAVVLDGARGAASVVLPGRSLDGSKPSSLPRMSLTRVPFVRGAVGLCSLRRGGRSWLAWSADSLSVAQGVRLPTQPELWQSRPLPGPIRQIIGLDGLAVAWVGNRQLLALDADGAILNRQVLPDDIDGVVALPLRHSILAWTRSGWFLFDAALVDTALLLRPISGVVPVSGAEVASDGVAGVWWLETTDGADRLWHATLDGLEVIVALRPASLPGMHSSRRLTAFPGRALVAVTDGAGQLQLWRVGATGPQLAGTGTLPYASSPRLRQLGCAASMTLLAVQRGAVWCTALHRSRPKHVDVGGHQLLAPQSEWRSRRFRAPLVNGLDAAIAPDPSHLDATETLSASGTVNRGGSVLSAPDLSDLVCDGVLLDPRRSETVRYSTAEQGVDAPLSTAHGRGGILVKVASSAAECGQPERDRVLLRCTQQGRVRFSPDATWFAALHPTRPNVASILSVVRHGPGERWFTAVTEIIRQPQHQRWLHRRTMQVHGAPWHVAARLTAPGAPELTLTVDQSVPGAATTESAVVDRCHGGVWHALGWEWSRTRGAAMYAGDGAAAHLSRPMDEQQQSSQRAAQARVFQFTDLDWSCEVGGALGDRAAHGSVQQLWLDDRVVAAPFVPPDVTAKQPSARWVLPPVFRAGDQLLRVAAIGDFSAGTGIDWRLEEWREDGLQLFRGSGRELLSLPAPATTRTTYVLQWTLRASNDGTRTPILEGVEVEWLAAPQVVTVDRQADLR